MFTAFQLLDKINTHVSELQFTRSPKGLYAPVEYVLSLGGKRIRPVLMLMGYNLYRRMSAAFMDRHRELRFIIIILCFMMT